VLTTIKQQQKIQNHHEFKNFNTDSSKICGSFELGFNNYGKIDHHASIHTHTQTHTKFYSLAIDHQEFFE